MIQLNFTTPTFLFRLHHIKPMKPQNTSGRAIRKILSGCALAAAPAMLWAQVSLYDFTQTQETWTEITAAQADHIFGTPVFNPPTTNNVCFVDPAQPNGVYNNGYIVPAVGPGYPIGFNFTYNGDVFDRIGISNAGWIGFGKSTDGNQAVQVFMSDYYPDGFPLVYDVFPVTPAYQRNRVAGWASSGLRQQDRTSVGGPLSSFRMATIGTAPNRVCVVQWSNFSSAYDSNGSSISFQIRLNEMDNSVDVRWGPMLWGYAGSGIGQVGLGGQSSSDFNARATVAEEPSFLYDWNQTVAAVTNTEFCNAAAITFNNANYSGIPPVEGLSFHWAPANCPPPTYPLTLSNISFDRATVSWTASAPGNYDYVVCTTNDPNDPDPVASGNAFTGSTFLAAGLQPLTDYYVFIRSICGGTPGVWSEATVFKTAGGAEIVCGEPALTSTHCQGQYQSTTWYYSTSDGTSPVRINFTAGYVGNTAQSLRIWYAADTTGAAAITLSSVADLTAYTYTSTGPYLTIKYITDAGSCESQPWFLPIEWEVGCLDCITPLVAFDHIDDCASGTFTVEVQLVTMGSATTINITNDAGVAPTTVTTTGTYTVGPFPNDVAVIVTAANPTNLLCSQPSVPLVNEPCALIGCGPTEYNYCYGPDENTAWLYQSPTSGLMGIRFKRGAMSFGDHAYLTNGAALGDPLLYTANALDDMSNVMRVTTVANTAGLRLDIASDDYSSCSDSDYFATPLDYVVACYDGCVQPTATFTVVDDCASQQYSVDVNLTAIGSAGTVAITNDAGAATVTATAIGTYTVGPFPRHSDVNFEIVGANQLCSWTSPTLTDGCLDIGIYENSAGQLQLFPNPSTGIFNMELPEGVAANAELRVQDMTGRVVHSQSVDADGGGRVSFDLGGLSSGAYVAVLNSNGLRYTGQVRVVR